MAAKLKQRQEALEKLNLGDFKEAEPLLRGVVEQTKEKNNAESYMWVRRLVDCLLGQGKFIEAEPLARSANSYFERRHGPNDEDALDCKFLLAESLHGQGKNALAHPIAESAYQGLKNVGHAGLIILPRLNAGHSTH